MSSQQRSIIIRDMRVEGSSFGSRLDGDRCDNYTLGEKQILWDLLRFIRGGYSFQNVNRLALCGHGNAGRITIGGRIINQEDVNNFSVIKDFFKEIVFLSCNVAAEFSDPPGDVFSGDGFLFCQSIARITKTPVVASSAKQRYEPRDPLAGGRMNPGLWEGNCMRFYPDGKVIHLKVNYLHFPDACCVPIAPYGDRYVAPFWLI